MSKKIKVSLLGNVQNELLLEGEVGSVEEKVVDRFFDLLSTMPTSQNTIKKEFKKTLNANNQNNKKNHGTKSDSPQKNTETTEEAVHKVVPVDSKNLEILTQHFKEGKHLKFDDLPNEDDLLDPNKNKHHIRMLDNGELLFSTKYSCPVCGNTGKRFSHITNFFVKCHECDMKIKLTPATQDFLNTKEKDSPIPKPDEDGYFFEAYDLFE